MIKRILFGAVYAGLILLTLGYQHWSGPVLLSVFSLAVVNEVAKLTKSPTRWIILLAVAAWLFKWNYAGISYGAYAELLLAGVSVVCLSMIHALFSKEPATALQSALTTTWYGFLPLAIGVVTALEQPMLILYIFALIWASDSFAYLAGKFFGKNPLAPSISPKKTIEGLIGGIAGTLAVAWGTWAYFIPESSVIAAYVVALLVAVLAPMGDLLASVLKRNAGVKDSGIFLPGHGGALDRLDSFIFAAPIIVLLYNTLL